MTQKRFRLFAALVPMALLTAADPPPVPGPSDIVAAAPATDWVTIAPSDLLVMELAPDARGKARNVIIQLIPEPISQAWVGNIRKLAAAHWWDGTAVVRVQDNYVVQWGDPDGEDAAKAKPLPTDLVTASEADYISWLPNYTAGPRLRPGQLPSPPPSLWSDAYATAPHFYKSWPVANDTKGRPGSEATMPGRYKAWPVHCYGMVGVGRNLSPDTGSGAELYTVIGHAPRHLDRNIALVGRVVEGMEHLSSLPRGTGPLGFYETAAERTVIRSVRLASDLPVAQQPRLEYLDSTSATFARYAEARANRKDAFFNVAAGAADICNIPVPIRKIAG